MNTKGIWSFDIGTSSVKALALLPEGKILGRAWSTHNLFYLESGRVESDPREWEKSFRDCIKILKEQSELLPEAVVIGGQGPTLVALSKEFKPLGNAISWMDRRATLEAEELSKEENRFIDSSFYMPKALWVMRNHPLKDQIAWLMPCPEYLLFRISGKVVSGLPALGFEGIIWDRDLMRKFGIREDIWPEYATCGRIIGSVTPEASKEFGIPEGTPVVLGVPDFIESWLGTGTIRPGRACDRGGSSQGINLCISQERKIPGLITLPHIVPGYWNISGVISTTGKAFEKVKEWVGMEKVPFEEAIRIAARAIPGSRGLIFVPHLAGERSPQWNPDTRGVFFGLSMHHRTEHLLRAVLEASGFAIKHIVELFQANALDLSEFRSTGKQAYSLEWTQIKADITNKPFLLPEIRESEPLGGAILGAVALGWYSGLQEAVNKMVRIEKIVNPNPENNELYEKMFIVYKSILQDLRERFREIGSWNLANMEGKSAHREKN